MKFTKAFLLTIILILAASALFSCKFKKDDGDEGPCSHDYETQIIEPNCTDEGYTKYTCKHCGYNYTNDIKPAKGHHFYERFCVFCSAEESFGVIAHDTSWYDSAKYEMTVNTKEQLAGLAYLVNTGADNFAGKTVTMKSHIDLESAEWTPIGTEEHPFAGVFNGLGLTVSNLKLNKDYSHVGLFGYSLGEIKNLDVKGASVTVSGYNQHVGIACGFSTKSLIGISTAGYVDAENCNYVGGVVGRVNGCVTNCTNAADVKGTDHVAGIAGWANIDGNYEFTELHNSGNISGHDQIAGIVGRLYAVTNTTANYTLKINNLSNAGEINSASHAGGIIAWAECWNYGAGVNTVKAEVLNNAGNVSGGWKAGGIFGAISCENGSYLKNSTSGANITAYHFVGGLVGDTDYLYVTDCSNAGTSVTCIRYAEVNGDVFAFLGGYVGQGYSVNNCVNDADITYNEVGKAVGGIIGASHGQITFCSNNGDIKTKGNMVGGIAGLVTNLSFAQIYYFNDLTNCGSISAINSVGGIFGHLERGNDFNNNTIHRINMNNMINSGSVCGGWNVGGIIGWGKTYDPDSYGGYLCGTNFTNSGSISANHGNVGELFGFYHSDDKNSFVWVYSILGQITSGGEVLVGDYPVGVNEGITITQ